MPDGGYKADPGQLNAGATAFNQEGTALTQASGKLEPHVAAGQVGKGWPRVAQTYAEAFAKFKDGVAKYGSASTQFGGSLSNAAGGYSSNEEHQQRPLKQEG